MAGEVIIDGVRVDLGALRSITHRCDPASCRGRKTCCGEYEIVIEEDELEKIVGYMPGAAGYASGFQGDEGLQNVFEETEDGLLTIDDDEDGLCVFSFCDREERRLCSLHAVGLEMGIPPHKVKPLACFLWPLDLSSGRRPVLSIHDDAFEFPCNAKRPQTESGLDRAAAQIIEAAFGQGFLSRLEKFLDGSENNLS